MSSPHIKYLLCPDFVRSKHDGQIHYIGACRLAELYGVDLRDCYIYEPEPWWPASFYEIAAERSKDLIRLEPRHDGDYNIEAANKLIEEE